MGSLFYLLLCSWLCAIIAPSPHLQRLEGCGSNECPFVPVRTWSRDIQLNLAQEQPHPLCSGPRAVPEARQYSLDELVAAVDAVSWEHTYDADAGINSWDLYPGGMALPNVTTTGQDGQDSPSPFIAPVEDGSNQGAYIGVKLTGPNVAVWPMATVIAEVLVTPFVRSTYQARFLEVAAVDGRRCFRAEELGAKRVVCTDYHGWEVAKTL